MFCFSALRSFSLFVPPMLPAFVSLSYFLVMIVFRQITLCYTNLFYFLTSGPTNLRNSPTDWLCHDVVSGFWADRLPMHDRGSGTEGRVTWPSSDFMGRSVFYRPAFSAFYRLFWKIAKLWGIGLKFSGFFSDVNIDNPAKCPEVAFSKIRIFRILVCNLQTRPHMPKFFFDFVAPYG